MTDKELIDQIYHDLRCVLDYDCLGYRETTILERILSYIYNHKKNKLYEIKHPIFLD